MSTYRLTSDKIAGQILITYTDDFLTCIKIEMATPLNYRQYDFLLANIKVNEWTLRKAGIELFQVTPVIPSEPLEPNEKIALFCRKYMDYNKGLKYKAYSKDGAMIKSFQLSADLLDTYFKSANFLYKNKYSIRNFITYYNEIRAEHAGLGKDKYPRYYCAELLACLNEKEKYEYKEFLAKHKIHLSL